VRLEQGDGRSPAGQGQGDGGAGDAAADDGDAEGWREKKKGERRRA
jgi:hypothetical protein